MYNYGGRDPFSIDSSDDFKRFAAIFLLLIFSPLLVLIIASWIIEYLSDIYEGYYAKLDLNKWIKWK